MPTGDKKWSPTELQVRIKALHKLQSQLAGKEAHKRSLESVLAKPSELSKEQKRLKIREYNDLRDEIAQIENRITDVKNDISRLQKQSRGQKA